LQTIKITGPIKYRWGTVAKLYWLCYRAKHQAFHVIFTDRPMPTFYENKRTKSV